MPRKLEFFDNLGHIFIPHYTSLRMVLLMWQMGQLDALTVISFVNNVAAHYVSMVWGQALMDKSFKPSYLLVPFDGLRIGMLWVTSADSIAERRTRIGTLAIMLGSSGVSILNSNMEASAASAGVALNHINFMKEQLKNIPPGGWQSSKVTYILVDGPHQIGINIGHLFTRNSNKTLELYRHRAFECQQIYENMIHNHALNRLGSGTVGQNSTSLAYRLGAPSLLINTVAVNQTTVILWVGFGFGLVTISIIGLLALFQWSERKRILKGKTTIQNDNIIIDVESTDCF